MGAIFSSPNKARITIQFRENKLKVIVPTTLPKKWRPRVDQKMWDHTMNQFQNCEIVPNREEILSQLSNITKKSVLLFSLVLIGLLLWILLCFVFTHSNSKLIYIPGIIILIICIIGAIKYGRAKDKIYDKYRSDVLKNMINVVNKLNITYNGYIMFHQPLLKYYNSNDDGGGKSKRYYIHIDIEMIVDFVDYIDDDHIDDIQQVAVVIPPQVVVNNDHHQSGNIPIVISNVGDNNLVQIDAYNDREPLVRNEGAH